MKAKSKLIRPTAEEDAQINAGIAADPDTFEWTEEDFARAKPAKEFFSPEMYEKLIALKRKPGERGPQKSPVKERITIRLSEDVVEQFRATGPGWQTRVDAALADWLKGHSASELAG